MQFLNSYRTRGRLLLPINAQVNLLLSPESRSVIFLMGTGGWLMLIEIIILFGFLVVFTVKMERELQRRRLHQI